MKIAICNMRLTKEKPYWEAQLNRYAMHNIEYRGRKVVRVEYGKQDIRGGFSICLFNDQHCVMNQKFFPSKDVMLGFVQGYNAALEVE